eukprot:TRINITY_DN4674_c0_g1_i2.p1 TRINITY_DN4674_c0_g1~~TRINITY_DN4674_c0_g1_i2.p1  ORF type:complete len:662 (+),score=304.24 TRINITY_DN4674_c0_g1_i2:227-1987(+)
MADLLESEDYTNLTYVSGVFNLQVFRAFEDEKNTSIIKEAKLVPFIVKCVKAMYKQGASNTTAHILENVLDVTEVVMEMRELHTGLFAAIHKELEQIGVDTTHALLNRRACLQCVQTALYGSDPNRRLVAAGVDRLAKFFAEGDDFPCQEFIAGIIGKLILKDFKVMDKLSTHWGEENAQSLKSIITKDHTATGKFVVEFNRRVKNPKVRSLACSEWVLGKKHYSAPQGETLLLHCTPTYLTLSLPVENPEQEVDTIDINTSSLQRLRQPGVHSPVGHIVFKTSKLTGEVLRFAQADSGESNPHFTIEVKSEPEEVKSFFTAMQGMMSKKRPTSKKRAPDGDAEDSPPEKAQKVAEKTTAPASAVAPTDFESEPPSVHIPPSSVAKRTPGRHAVPVEVKATDPSPFQTIAGQIAEDDVGEGDLYTVFDRMKEKVVEQTRRKQERGQQALQKTVETVQLLVDDYKKKSREHNDALQENIDIMKEKANKLLEDTTETISCEHEITSAIKMLHEEFNQKAKAQRDLLIAFQEDIEDVVPQIESQEKHSLAKLKDMADAEFENLETQVTKLQSQNKFITSVMKFMMAKMD